PKMRVSERINELHIHPHLIVGFLNASLNNVSDAKLLGDLAQISRRAFIFFGRGPRDDFQIADLCQSSEDFVLHTFCKIGVVRIAAEVIERQNCNRFIRNCSGLALKARPRLRLRYGSRRSGDGAVATEKKQPDRHEHAHNDYINPDVLLSSCSRRHRVRGFGTLNSLRRQLEHPGENQRNRQTRDDQNNQHPNRPGWNVEHRKYLGDSLRKCPPSDDVGNGDLVHVAPLQLGEEIARVHFEAGAGWDSSFWNRGSLRSGSHIGSYFKFATVRPAGTCRRCGKPAMAASVWPKRAWICARTISAPGLFTASVL